MREKRNQRLRINKKVKYGNDEQADCSLLNKGYTISSKSLLPNELWVIMWLDRNSDS